MGINFPDTGKLNFRHYVFSKKLGGYSIRISQSFLHRKDVINLSGR